MNSKEHCSNTQQLMKYCSVVSYLVTRKLFALVPHTKNVDKNEDFKMKMLHGDLYLTE
jgi:hypothetical protein